jgi:hypothetical protein
VSQRRSGPCGLFSRAEDKVKLSDDEILLDAHCIRKYGARQGQILRAPRSSGRSPDRIADSSSTNAVSFSSARTTKRFPSPRCRVNNPGQSPASFGTVGFGSVITPFASEPTALAFPLNFHVFRGGTVSPTPCLYRVAITHRTDYVQNMKPMTSSAFLAPKAK